MKIIATINTHLCKAIKEMSKRLVMSFLLIVIVLGCSRQPGTNLSELEKQFTTTVPVKDMNQSLQLAVDGEEKSFRAGSRIRLIIYNKSPYFVYFDNESHIRLLSNLDNHQWVDVKNAITYSDTMLLSPKGTVLLDHQYTLVRPILDQSDFSRENSDIPLRIVVVGEIMKDETRTGQNVGAYVDLVLKP
jgi:hypothetical protein